MEQKKNKNVSCGGSVQMASAFKSPVDFVDHVKKRWVLRFVLLNNTVEIDETPTS